MENLKNFLMLRPAIRLQYDSEGSFSEYARRFRLRMPVNQGSRLIEHIIEWVGNQRSMDVDKTLLRTQLIKYPLISSADHASILNNKILFNSNILLMGIMDSQSLPYQLVFATTRIPLDNVVRPKGFSFRDLDFNFFSSSKNHIMVCLLNEGLKRFAKQVSDLTTRQSLGGLSIEENQFLEKLFFEYIEIQSVIEQNSIFKDQLSLMNYRLWPHFFESRIRSAVPKLIYIPIDSIIINILKSDLQNMSSRIYVLLFEARIRKIYLEEFNSIQGCWSETKGAHFFWGVSKKLRLLALRVSHDGQFLVPFSPTDEFGPIRLSPASIIEALEKRQIVPSLFIEMYLIAFVEGFTLFGGFNQVTYLAWMRVAHERAMLRMGEWAEAAKYARTPTDGLICGPIAFPQWNSSFDMMWDFNSTNGKFNGNLDRGLTYDDIDTMMNTPFKDLIKNGIDDMLEVIE